MRPYLRNDYLRLLGEATEGIEDGIFKFMDEIFKIKNSGRRMWILGNGGSLAVAQHFAQDLVKRFGVRAQCLNDPSIITAYANDHSFDYSYYGPLEVLKDNGDIILIFSCSGKSRNYIEFISQRYGNANRIFSIVGTDGGFLKEKSDFSIYIKSDDYALCETAFSMVADLICYGLEKRCQV